MACPWVVDGGERLQIWMTIANTMNKWLWTADREWSSSLEVGQGANSSSLKKPSCYKMLHRASELNQ